MFYTHIYIYIIFIHIIIVYIICYTYIIVYIYIYIYIFHLLKRNIYTIIFILRQRPTYIMKWVDETVRRLGYPPLYSITFATSMSRIQKPKSSSPGFGFSDLWCSNPDLWYPSPDAEVPTLDTWSSMLKWLNLDSLFKF